MIISLFKSKQLEVFLCAYTVTDRKRIAITPQYLFVLTCQQTVKMVRPNRKIYTYSVAIECENV